MNEFADRVLESDVEDAVVAWAENHGWVVRKVAYLGRRGCPDRFFFGFGQIVMIEFKKLNEPLSGNQRRERRLLALADLTVHVIEDAEVGIDLLRRAMP